MVVDVDCLKTINDSLGHSVSDQPLVAVVQRVATAFGSRDTLTHLGGDEFGLLVEGCVGSVHARRVTDRIHAVLRRPSA